MLRLADPPATFDLTTTCIKVVIEAGKTSQAEQFQAGDGDAARRPETDIGGPLVRTVLTCPHWCSGHLPDDDGVMHTSVEQVIPVSDPSGAESGAFYVSIRGL